jgi:translation initiation factor 3 subunit L
MSNHNDERSLDFNLPKQIEDFLFDLQDSVCRSHIQEDVQRLYEIKYREVSEKYFGTNAWPDAKVVAPVVFNDEFFLALYR